MTLRVSSELDGGNARVIEVREDGRVRLELKKDAGDRFLQWFCFRVSGGRGRALELRIENAHDAAYPKGYVDYRAVASSDRERWLRVPTRYEDGVLVIRDTPTADLVTYAYFAPYPMERHHALIARCQADPRVAIEVLGQSLDGQDLECVRVGEGARTIWLIARQHPGETMAEHFMEGLLARLLDPEEPVARALLRDARFFIVPNMNPDGSRRGYLRTNAAGANLNREWLEPTMERSPEVFVVRARMQETSVDLCLDVHGDEELPYVFLAGPDGVPSLTAAQRERFSRFSSALERLSPDFQTAHGYPPAAAGQANMRMCTNWVAEALGALTATLEMPFKDAANHPHEETGWSPARSRHLGRAVLDAIWAERAGG